MQVDIPGYTVLETLHTGKNFTIFRALKEADRKSVILKVLNAEYTSTKMYAKLKHEYDLITKLDVKNVRKGYALEFVGSYLVLVLEDFGGTSLSGIKSQTKQDMDLFFILAIQLAEGVGDIHHHNIIHKDIKPSNILVNVNTKEAKIIDLGIATSLSREIQKLVSPDSIEGTISYISPEQTGRMNRAIDYRTDIYSLGITFYEMATGQLPFHSADLMEMVHKHIAIESIPPERINNKIPRALSLIILKCLEKDPEKRYNSAYGLKNDLEACYLEYKEVGKIGPFVPGKNDVYDRFKLPTKLYGRKQEKELLLNVFTRSSEGRAEILQVIGSGGIGKTSLIHEILKPILGKKGYFCSGKFEQFKLVVPYNGLIQAIQELIRQILGGSDKEITTWRERIQGAVEQNGQLLIDMIPELELIIGEQPPLPVFDVQSAEMRLKITFANFLEEILSPEHPIVLFLDDLQWVDISTLKLLEFLMGNKYLKHLLMIFSFRLEEIGEDHPLIFSIKEIEKAKTPITTLKVNPLDIHHVAEILADTCHCDKKNAKEFAELVHRKTKGNPFFVLQFLKEVYKEKFLDFNKETKQWEWDLQSIEKMPSTENVAQLMTYKIRNLSSKTQQILQMAAAIGGVFDWTTLRNVFEGSSTEAAAGIYEALMEELIFIVKGANTADVREILGSDSSGDVLFSFQHDRILTAAYGLIPSEMRSRLHTRIGEVMLREVSEGNEDKRILDIVNQLNYGIEDITTDTEKERMAKLNLRAGLKAKESTAYLQAKRYFTTGKDLLIEKCWENQYELSISIFENLATCELMTGNLKQADDLFTLAIKNVKTISEKARFYYIQIYLYSNMAEFQKAVDTFVIAMKLYNVDIKLPTKKRTLIYERLKTTWYLWTRNLDNIKEISPSKDQDAYWMGGFYAAACYALHRLGHFEIIAFKSTNLMFSSGISEYTAMAMCYLPMLYTSGQYQKYSKAFDLVSFVYRLTSRYPNTLSGLLPRLVLKCSVETYYKNTIEIIQPLRDLEKECARFGISAWAGTCLTNLAFNTIIIAENIYLAYEEIERIREQLHRRYRLATGNTSILFLTQFCKAVLGKAEDIYESCPPEFKDEVHKEKIDSSKIPIPYYVTWKVRLLLLHEKYDQILEIGEKTKTTLRFSHGHPLWQHFSYYHALGVVAACEKPEIRQKHQEDLTFYGNWLKTLAKTCPITFRFKYLIFLGELERIEGRYEHALECYQDALMHCKMGGYIQDEALIYELIGKCYLRQKKQLFSSIFLSKAYAVYSAWGGIAKLNQMKKKYPKLLKLIPETVLKETTSGLIREGSTLTRTKLTSVSTTSKLESHDMSIVIPILQKISEGIHMEELVINLLLVILDLTNAEKTGLVLSQDRKLTLIGEMSRDDDTPTVKAIPVRDEQESFYVDAIVESAEREKKILIENATHNKFISHHPVIRIQSIKSIYCIPLIYQGKLNGVLYMHSSGDLNNAGLGRLSFLSSHIAISLEHARLYMDLEEKVKDRSQKLKESQKKLTEQAKMESLGLITLGIAHEVSNPLNFVINYSDIFKDNLEVINTFALESKDSYPNWFSGVKETLEKLKTLIYTINDNGGKAGHVIKRMVEQTELKMEEFSSTVLHTVIDNSINTILRMRQAAGEQIRVEMIKDYDPKLRSVEIIPAEINRVLKNVLENSYDTLEDKFYTLGQSFNPTIMITTKNLGKTCEIRIRDNGKGMDPQIAQKIFNPFVTTKPFGKGLGLALSLCHSIIVQEHSGTIGFDTEEGEFTEMIITLPVVQEKKKL